MSTLEARGRLFRGFGGSVAVVLGALVCAGGMTVAMYGGSKWALATLLGLFGLVAVGVWMLARRDFLGTATFFLTVSLPLVIDVQVWEPAVDNSWTGFPVGLTIFLKDFFLAALGFVWLVELVGGMARPTPRLGWAWRGPMLMLASALLFPVHSTDVPRSFIAWTELARAFLAFGYLAKRLDNERFLRWIFLGVAAQIWLESFIAGLEYVLGHPLGLTFLGEGGVRQMDLPDGAILRSGALLGHPNSLALYMNLTCPVVLALALRARTLGSAIGWWSTYAVGSATLVLTFSRAGWALAAVGFLAVYYLVQSSRGRPLVLSVVLPVFAAAFVLLGLFVGFEPFRDRLLMPDGGSATTRFQQFRTAFSVIGNWPVAGTGLGSYLAGAWNFLAGEGSLNSLMYRVHNGSLLMTAETGILGGIGYHIWWWTILRRGWGVWRLSDEYLATVGIGTFVGLSCWFLKSQYNIHTPINETSLVLHAGLMFAVVHCAMRKARETQEGALAEATESDVIVGGGRTNSVARGER